MSNEVTIDVMNEVIARFMGGTRVLHPEQKFFNEDFYGYVCHDGRSLCYVKEVLVPSSAFKQQKETP